MSWWSMTAISPGLSRLVRFLVRVSTRTKPRTPGVSGSRARWRVNFKGILAILPWGTGSPVRPHAGGQPQPASRRDRGDPLAANRRRPPGGGLLDELARMVEGGASVDAGHHPSELAQPLLTVESVHPAGGDVSVAGLADDQVPVGVCRD